MLQNLKQFLKNIFNDKQLYNKQNKLIADLAGDLDTACTRQLMLSAIPMVNANLAKKGVISLKEVEFKCFSQFGDDGIIQYLIHRLDLPTHTFIEFGVEDYRESNTRFLLMNDNWRGLIIDGSSENIEKVRQRDIYWKHDLTAISAFIDAANINDLISSAGFSGEVGILSIDIDGNDYWVWEAISVVDPIVVVVEYNSVFGGERAISVPYDPKFVRATKHYSSLYYGASLNAFRHLGATKGYDFVGCNSAGNNSYFVRRDRLAAIESLVAGAAYVESKFRESRSELGRLSFVSGKERNAVISGLPVVNVVSGVVEAF